MRGFAFFVLVLLSAGCLSVSDRPTDPQVGEDQDSALAVGLALMERGNYSEAVASFESGLAEAALPAAEKARLFHGLGRALIFAPARPAPWAWAATRTATARAASATR